MEEISYSIWLMPEGELKKRVYSIIKEHHEKYGSPLFEPHITLIGSFGGDEQELKNKTKILASKLKPFTVTLDKVSYLDEFFRSLFFTVKKTPDFLEARKKALKVFGLPQEKYLPHMSLIYGNFDAEDKKETSKKIGKFSGGFEVRKIYLVTNDEKSLVWTVKGGCSLGD